MNKKKKSRETMQSWLDSNGIDYPKALASSIQKDGQTHELREILGRLWNCTDILPARYCQQLDLPIGISYAKAVRELFKSLSK